MLVTLESVIDSLTNSVRAITISRYSLKAKLFLILDQDERNFSLLRITTNSYSSNGVGEESMTDSRVTNILLDGRQVLSC